MSKRKCPICSCNEKKRIEQIKLLLPEEYQLPSEYWIVECDRCGFSYADTGATIENYNHYYATCNTYSGIPDDVEEREYLYNDVNELLKGRVDKSDSLMDIGFGKGEFLSWLNENHYINIMGLDPSVESVARMNNRGINAVVGNIYDLPLANLKKRMKCVFLFAVLEHLLYPKEAIFNIKTYLEEDGYLILNVPNCACLDNSYPILDAFNQEHINYFSIISLDNIMAECGFKKIESKIIQRGEEILALYQLKDNKNSKLEKDTICSKEIRRYISKFSERKVYIQEQLNVLKKHNITEIYVWGTGAYTMWLLANSMLMDFSIQFIDNNTTKIGKNLGAGRIYKPDCIKNQEKPIVICSMLYSQDIKKQILRMGLKNEIVIL